MVQRELIFDFGMNRCEDTAFYLARGFRVVAVEANPSACAAARDRFHREIDQGSLIVLNVAISSDSFPLRFFVCDTNSSWSTASAEHRDEWIARGAKYREISVPGVTVNDIVSKFGVPYYAKIDLEGFDTICLEGWLATAVRPRYMSFEVDFRNFEDMIAVANRLGYSEFVMVGQGSVERQVIPDPPREGNKSSLSPRRGSSGLFGLELAGPWVKTEPLLGQCRRVIRHHRNAKALRLVRRLPGAKTIADKLAAHHAALAGDWYDIHCRREQRG